MILMMNQQIFQKIKNYLEKSLRYLMNYTMCVGKLGTYLVMYITLNQEENIDLRNGMVMML